MPHAARDPKILKDKNLENEDIFELIKNPPEIGAVEIFEQPELWDTSIGPIQAVTTQGIATVYLPSGPLSMDGAQWHTGHCYRLSTIGPSKYGWSTMAPFETYPDERWPQSSRIKHTKRTYTTAETRQG